MWIFFPDGFISVVADRQDSDTLLLRSRRLDHLQQFCRGIEQLPPELDPVDSQMVLYRYYEHSNSDYQYRIILPRRKFKELFSCHVNRLDYDNFKDSINDDDFHDCCVEVWRSISVTLEERDRWSK